MKIRSAMYVDVVVNLLLAVIAFAAMSRLNAATGWEYIGPILVIAALSSAILHWLVGCSQNRPAVRAMLMLDFLASAGAVILGLSNPCSWSRWLTIALFAGALLAAIMGTMKLQAELASRLQFFKSRYACVLLRSYSRLA